jgi:hypothetical protein
VSGAETELNGRAVAAGRDESGVGTAEATAGPGSEANGAGTVAVGGAVTGTVAAAENGVVTDSVGGALAD